MCLRCFGGCEGGLFLGEHFCWHPVLPEPASPLRRALLPDAPVVCSGFGFDRLCSLGSSVGKLSCPTPPRHPAARPDATRPWYSGFWNRQVKYELDCSCFRRNVQDSVLDSLEGKREGCFLAGSTQRRPALPSPAPPRRPAVRRSDPAGPWCVRVLDSTSVIFQVGRRL